MKFSIKDFFSKCDQIPRKLPIWSHLLKKSFMENFFFHFFVQCIIVKHKNISNMKQTRRNEKKFWRLPNYVIL